MAQFVDQDHDADQDQQPPEIQQKRHDIHTVDPHARIGATAGPNTAGFVSITFCCHPAGRAVDFQYFSHTRRLSVRHRIQRCCHHPRNCRESRCALQKSADRDFVGRIQNTGGRPALPQRFVSQPEQRELFEIRRDRTPIAAPPTSRSSAPARPRVPATSARTESASACPSPRPARSRCRLRTPPSRESRTADAPRPQYPPARNRKASAASITSNPLFIRVAESMVMRFPIFHVGCFRASAGVTQSMASLGVVRNGPPEAVRISFRRFAAQPRPQTLMRAVVFGIDRHQFRAVPLHRIHDQLAARNQHFFIGQADPLAPADRLVSRLQTGHTHDRRHDGINFGCHWRPERSASAPLNNSGFPVFGRSARSRSTSAAVFHHGDLRAGTPESVAPAVRCSARRPAQTPGNARDSAEQRPECWCRLSRSSPRMVRVRDGIAERRSIRNRSYHAGFADLLLICSKDPNPCGRRGGCFRGLSV